MYNPTASDYYSGKPPWIRDKKRFRLALIMTAVLTILNIRYPGIRPLYEEALRAIHLPTSIPLAGNGYFSYTGLIFLGFALWTLFLIWDSLNRHRILSCLALFWIIPAVSSAVLTGYQMLIPSSVYALSVEEDQANCIYLLKDGKMTGNCSITIKNHSNREITVEQTGRIFFGSPSNEDQTVLLPLGSVTLGARQAMQTSPTFSVEMPGPADQQATGSGHASLSINGFNLEMNDGTHVRNWGE